MSSPEERGDLALSRTDCGHVPCGISVLSIGAFPSMDMGKMIARKRETLALCHDWGHPRANCASSAGQHGSLQERELAWINLLRLFRFLSVLHFFFILFETDTDDTSLRRHWWTAVDSDGHSRGQAWRGAQQTLAVGWNST